MAFVDIVASCFLSFLRETRIVDTNSLIVDKNPIIEHRESLIVDTNPRIESPIQKQKPSNLDGF
jgi:hypothetical protein